jgi:transposase
MDHTQFIADLLGIKGPWFITKVTTDHSLKRVDIWVDHHPGIELPCPTCEEYCSVYDHGSEREFRHLDVFQMQTYIHVRLPRIHCKRHGVLQVVSGLGEEASGMTYEFERFILDLAQECSVESISRLAGIHWHSCWRTINRAVERGKSRKPHVMPQRFGVDEKSFAKGHKYETLIYDIDNGTVEYVSDNREQSSLEEYYRQFSKEQRAQVQSVAMDMWDPYIAATKAYIPDAEKKIVFDRFHVMKYVVDAVDKVRKAEHTVLKEQGNDILKGTKYLWLWSQENVPQWRKEEFDVLRNRDLKVCKAWAIKENIRHMWEYRYEGCMRKYFDEWYWWATHSRLEPIINAAKTLKRHIDNVVTYARHRITNALGESLNAKIEKVKRFACGYRNREHYKTAIYFHCGGLDLYPRRKGHQLQIIGA